MQKVNTDTNDYIIQHLPDGSKQKHKVDRALLCLDACKHIPSGDLVFLFGAFAKVYEKAEHKFMTNPYAKIAIDRMRTKKKRKRRKLPTQLNTCQKRDRAFLCLNACDGIEDDKLLPRMFEPVLSDTKYIVMNDWMEDAGEPPIRQEHETEKTCPTNGVI